MIRASAVPSRMMMNVMGPLVSVKMCFSPRLYGEMSDHVVFPEPSRTENDAFFKSRRRRSLPRFDIHEGSSKFEPAVSAFPHVKAPPCLKWFLLSFTIQPYNIPRERPPHTKRWSKSQVLKFGGKSNMEEHIKGKRAKKQINSKKDEKTGQKTDYF